MKKLLSFITFAVFSHITLPSLAASIPMRLDNRHWQTLEYNNIRANQVTQLEHGLKIQVNNSASPLIYVFDQPRTISEVTVMGIMDSLPIIPPGLKQGEQGADDFPFRLGLVLEGDKTLNFAQRLIAAQWVKILFDLAPDDTGIDHIMFLNLANSDMDPDFSTTREHPDGSGLFTETIVERAFAGQSFNFSYALAMPRKVIALWISADGDDTNSNYALTVNSISYN